MKTFKLEGLEESRANHWIKLQKKKDPSNFTIGERWSYIFTPTGLGTMVIIKDNLLEETMDVTDYDLW
jgi:hypothetical protein